MALGARTRRWLAETAGVPDSTVSDALARGIAKADTAVRIADALGVSLDWLMTGRSPSAGKSVALAESAEWIDVPEYDLAGFSDAGPPDPRSVTPFRRDWLYGELGEATGLWIARLAGGYGPRGLPPGAPVFCKTRGEGEPLLEGAHYLFRVNGGVFPARFSFRPQAAFASALSDPVVTPPEIGPDPGEHYVVARIVGTIARPL